MADSTLDMTGEESPVTNLGHGTRSLGPSDSSDTGSDVTGGPGMDEGLSDEQARQAPLKSSGTAGRDLGDADLDSDSDRSLPDLVDCDGECRNDISDGHQGQV